MAMCFCLAFTLNMCSPLMQHNTPVKCAICGLIQINIDSFDNSYMGDEIACAVYLLVHVCKLASEHIKTPFQFSRLGIQVPLGLSGLSGLYADCLLIQPVCYTHVLHTCAMHAYMNSLLRHTYTYTEDHIRSTLENDMSTQHYNTHTLQTASKMSPNFLKICIVCIHLF